MSYSNNNVNRNANNLRKRDEEFGSDLTSLTAHNKVIAELIFHDGSVKNPFAPPSKKTQAMAMAMLIRQNGTNSKPFQIPKDVVYTPWQRCRLIPSSIPRLSYMWIELNWIELKFTCYQNMSMVVRYVSADAVSFLTKMKKSVYTRLLLKPNWWQRNRRISTQPCHNSSVFRKRFEKWWGRKRNSIYTVVYV